MAPVLKAFIRPTSMLPVMIFQFKLKKKEFFHKTLCILPYHTWTRWPPEPQSNCSDISSLCQIAPILCQKASLNPTSILSGMVPNVCWKLDHSRLDFIPTEILAKSSILFQLFITILQSGANLFNNYPNPSKCISLTHWVWLRFSIRHFAAHLNVPNVIAALSSGLMLITISWCQNSIVWHCQKKTWYCLCQKKI